MRVQFTVTDKEYDKLRQLASGYPDVSSYCKDMVLQDTTWGKLWKIVVDKISNMESGYGPFALRDLVPTPPANMGVKLFQNQEALGIEYIKKDALNTATYKKK